jgi:hypothetical protein
LTHDQTKSRKESREIFYRAVWNCLSL